MQEKNLFNLMDDVVIFKNFSADNKESVFGASGKILKIHKQFSVKLKKQCYIYSLKLENDDTILIEESYLKNKTDLTINQIEKMIEQQSVLNDEKKDNYKQSSLTSIDELITSLTKLKNEIKKSEDFNFLANSYFFLNDMQSIEKNDC